MSRPVPVSCQLGVNRLRSQCGCRSTTRLKSSNIVEGHVTSLISAIDASQPVSLSGSGYNVAACFIAGALCASLSHALAIPIDVVKTKQQLDDDLRGINPVEALRTIINREGMQSLIQGAGPTTLGYAVQGSLKYGLYEILKPKVAASIIAVMGDDFTSPIMDFLISGALAEAVGSSALTPFEAARIRLVSYPGSGGIIPCISRMWKEGGMRTLFIGYPAIISKQIPYTSVSLCTFEIVSKYIYSQVLGVGTAMVDNPTIGYAVARGGMGGEISSGYGDATIITSAATAILTMESIPSLTRFQVTFAAAIVAALIGAVVSQPGDTLLTMLNQRTRTEISIKSWDTEMDPIALMAETARDLGIRGLFAGFRARLLHVMTIVVSQLLIYDATKQAVSSIINHL